MVLYKRKPVHYVPHPTLSDHQEIWVIKETDEIFTNYDEYLARMDYYKQKRFMCEITGHSGMDFFSAYRNEVEASNEVDDAFPDPLKEPILRKVQHSTISRIDNLVDHVFDEFKQDFYPGESVTVTVDDVSLGKMHGIIREKSRFPEIRNANGALKRQAYCRYFVSLTDKPGHEALVDHEHVFRDRKVFTKQILRSFLKNSLHREAWSGAPWQVKDKLAQEYRINSFIPVHLRYEHQVAQRKVNLNARKGEHDGTIMSFSEPQKIQSETKSKSQKSKQSAQDADRLREEQLLAYRRTSENPASQLGDHNLSDHDSHSIFINHSPGLPVLAVKRAGKLPGPPPPPPIKYPREDLENPLSTTTRPALNFLSKDLPGESSKISGNGILMESVGPLLETWDTLNVYCEVFILDSFTFDDYVDALQFQSEEIKCELLDELHCAVLKKLVNEENELNGKVMIRLPEADETSDDEGSEESSRNETTSPEPEAPVRTTRSSLAKSEAAELKARAAQNAKIHRGTEIDQCVKGYGWKMRLRKRDFANGRWAVIIVGLLSLYASQPRLKDSCDNILKALAPLNMEPSEETAIFQYSQLDINVRVRIIQFLCLLSLETKAIRSYMEDCTASMTQFRKERIEWQRKRKAYLEELRALDEERRALQPESDSPAAEIEELEQALKDEDMKEPEEEVDTNMDTEDENPVPQRSLRRANDRARERNRKLEEEKKQKEKLEAEKSKKPTREARQLEKILKKIDEAKENIKECEAEVLVCENDLRESDCPRTRVLGKDRFWNRYYWFERNAMPYAGLPDSSTASAGYANGRVWVQGPDEIERIGFIDLSDAENMRYKDAFGVTVPERKVQEEGQTSLYTAYQWGYYEDPDEVDKLIAWLSDKGTREIKLRKELQLQRKQISLNMEKRNAYLNKTGEKRSQSTEPATRVSTRTKTYVDAASHRFMSWRNSTALRELGHLHSEPIRPQRRGVGRATNGKRAVEEEGRQTRGAINKQGKPLGRQGTRYNF